VFRNLIRRIYSAIISALGTAVMSRGASPVFVAIYLAVIGLAVFSAQALFGVDLTDLVPLPEGLMDPQ